MRAACVSTGLAVLGASVLVAPITSPPTGITTVTSTVRLAAAPKPSELYPLVAQRAAFFTASLAQQYFADPVPISRAVINNQVAAVSNIIEAVGSGDPAAVLAALSEAVTQPIENAIKAGSVVVDLSWYLAMSTISPALQVVASTEFAFREVVAAIAALDLADLVNSLLDIPAHLVNGVINGGYPLASPFDSVRAGILMPAGSLMTIPGPIATLIVLDQQVAQAISPQSAVSATPLQRPAAADSQNIATPAEEKRDANRLDAGSAVKDETALKDDRAVKDDRALKDDIAVDADAAVETAPEAPAQRSPRHGARGAFAPESTLRPDRSGLRNRDLGAESMR